MASDDLIEMDGVVIESSRDTFIVEVPEQEQKIIAHISGKLRQHNIRILEGDRVKVAVSPYDLTKGRIVFRYK